MFAGETSLGYLTPAVRSTVRRLDLVQDPFDSFGVALLSGVQGTTLQTVAVTSHTVLPEFTVLEGQVTLNVFAKIQNQTMPIDQFVLTNWAPFAKTYRTVAQLISVTVTLAAAGGRRYIGTITLTASA